MIMACLLIIIVVIIMAQYFSFFGLGTDKKFASSFAKILSFLCFSSCGSVCSSVYPSLFSVNMSVCFLSICSVPMLIHLTTQNKRDRPSERRSFCERRKIPRKILFFGFLEFSKNGKVYIFFKVLKATM